METLVKKKLKLNESNRIINRTHVDKIIESIRKHGYLPDKAILVNENMEIIDGQHRYQACVELGIDPIYKVVKDADDDLMIDLNSSQTSWGVQDYIHYYANKGLIPYQLLSEFMEKNKLNSTLAISLLKTDDGRIHKIIRAGELICSKRDVEQAQQIFEFAQLIAGECRLPINRYLCRALRQLSNIENFQWGRLLEQIDHNRDRVYQCSKTTSYVDMFKAVYNFRKKNRV